MDAKEVVSSSVRRWRREDLVIQIVNPPRRCTLAVYNPLYVDGEAFFPNASQIEEHKKLKESLELERKKRLK